MYFTENPQPNESLFHIQQLVYEFQIPFRTPYDITLSWLGPFKNFNRIVLPKLHEACNITTHRSNEALNCTFCTLCSLFNTSQLLSLSGGNEKQLVLYYFFIVYFNKYSKNFTFIRYHIRAVSIAFLRLATPCWTFS